MAKNNAALAMAFLKKESSPTLDQREEFKESFEVTKPASMSGFRGMFGEVKLSEQEEGRLQSILDTHHQTDEVRKERLSEDYQTLKRITAEIKAINNQSILLHGERIRKAQTLLKSYADGAFTEWLLATYGNRQTPYSMLQYYEFYQQLPGAERLLLENMPKKAAYTLASREGALERKLEIINSYSGETQGEVILLIQESFPSSSKDKRAKSVNQLLLSQLEKLITRLEGRRRYLAANDKDKIDHLAKKLLAI